MNKTESVSVIVPCLNEEATIVQLLDAIYAQNYDRSRLEVVVADGLSIDNTRANIENFKKTKPDLVVKIIDNPSRKIPVGLNSAIAASKGDFLVRLDAHCVPYPDYIRRSIEGLTSGKGLNVGGVWKIKPGARGWIAKSIAEAASHPWVVGDAFYRFARVAGEVDTVPFGSFRRELIKEIGGFNELLDTNEDYEFNARIRKIGGRVWLDPAIRSIYFARPNLLALARQYARYGFWKWRMLRQNPETLRLRQVLPPLLVSSLIILIPLSIALPWLQWAVLVEVVSYVLLLLSVAFKKALDQKRVMLIIGIPLAIATMHLVWGAAFLLSMSSLGRNKENRN